MGTVWVPEAKEVQDTTISWQGDGHSILGRNAMTSSIRIALVFPELVGKKTHATLKVYVEMIKYIVNSALYLAHYDAYFHINDDAKKCRYLSVTCHK